MNSRSGDDMLEGATREAGNILCPQCKTIILRSGAYSVSPASNVPEQFGKQEGAFLAVRDMYDFENVAFSRPIAAGADDLRLLACAECQTCLLGWARLAAVPPVFYVVPPGG